MTKLPKGPLKIIAPVVKHAIANRQRAGAGSTRFKHVWLVFVLNADGVTFTPYSAFTFRTGSLTPRHEPLGIKKVYPQANSAMRVALSSGLWFETRSEITLDFDTVASEPTTEETPANG
jgi:hypothetical protein